MTLYNFIFSEKKQYRLVRHLSFWIVYCTYFYLQSLAPRKYDEFFIIDTYYFAFLNLCCFAPVFIFAVYFFIYFLLPKTLQKKKYALFVFGFLMVYSVGTLINYFMAGIFLNSVHYSVPVESNFQHRLEFGNYNTRWGMIIAIIALGIKLSKDWYLQQKENLEIIKRKTKSEMQFEKARIHPELLLRSLDSIYNNIKCENNKAPQMILNLSEVLSYSLYENENVMVLLKNELTQLQHLIMLEQDKKKSSIQIEMLVKGDIINKYIAPMILVKMLEQIITCLYDAEIHSSLIQLDLNAENEILFLVWSIKNENELAKINWRLFIKHTQNRLSSYYNQPDFNVTWKEYQNEIIISLQLKFLKQAREMNLS